MITHPTGYESEDYPVNGRKQLFHIESRTPILTRQEREERLQQTEERLFEVFSRAERTDP